MMIVIIFYYEFIHNIRLALCVIMYQANYIIFKNLCYPLLEYSFFQKRKETLSKYNKMSRRI